MEENQIEHQIEQECNSLQLRNRAIKKTVTSSHSHRSKEIDNQSFVELESIIRSEKSESKKSSRSSRKFEIEIETLKRIQELEKEKEIREFERQKELVERQKELETRELERQKALLMKEMKMKKAMSNGSRESSGISMTSCSKNTYVKSWIEKSRSKISADTPAENKKECGKEDETLKISNDMKFYLSRKNIKDLPKFSGNPIEWPFFLAQYTSSNKEAAFTGEERLARLRDAISGKARESVEALLYMPGSAEMVIEKLRNRFGRADLIVKNVLKDLDNIPSMKEEGLIGLSKLAEKIDTVVNVIKLVNRTEYLHNPTLLENLVNKLNCHLKLQWGENNAAKFGDVPISIESFNCWLQSKAEAVYYAGNLSEQQHQSGTNRKNINVTSCLFCELKNHSVEFCKKFRSMNKEERFKWCAEKKVCFCCFRNGHRSSECRSKIKCRFCQGRHNDLLHMEKPKSSALTTNITNVNSDDNNKNNTTVLLKVLPIRLRGPSATIDTFALLDDGSTITMIDDTIANQLGLEGKVSPLTVRWSNDITHEEENSRIVSVKISGRKDTDTEFVLYDIRTVGTISIPVQSLDVGDLAQKWKHLQGVDIQKYSDAKPTVLIGQDNWPLLIALKTLYGPWKGPAASKTRLGWVIHGRVPAKLKPKKTRTHPETTMCHWMKQDTDQSDSLTSLHSLVKELLVVDNYLATEIPILSPQEKLAMAICKETTIKREGFWETGLLWKETCFLPDSKKLALSRLRSVEKKMDRDPEFAKRYCLQMDKFFQSGYASKFTDEDRKLKTDKIWFLPHLGVTNPQKPGKLRICFDASAKVDGVSLNDALLQGPDLLVSLPGLLWRFREQPIAFGGDIKEMFPQVKIRHIDQLAQQFFWRGMDRDHPPETFVMRSMIFGAVCSPFSAQEVKNVNAKEFETQFPASVDAILNNHYMDDYLDSTETIEQAVSRIKEVIYIHKQGGFTMCNWLCNSSEVILTIPEDLRTTSANNMSNSNVEDIPIFEKLLGLWWNMKRDSFCFKPVKFIDEYLNVNKIPTKREVLKCVMTVFDPLGFLAPLIVGGKILLQEIWKSGIAWDDHLTPNLHELWNFWLKKIQNIDNIEIPRCYGTGLLKSKYLQLHVFCDASEQACATVAYVRSISNSGAIEVNFISSKTRVAPLKNKTIPKLELTAAALGSKLATNIMKEHRVKFSEKIFWSDSVTVIKWLRKKENDIRKLPKFVCNRVEEILEYTNEKEWNWIGTKHNVADEATRAANNKQVDLRYWFRGPSFLYANQESWPKQPEEIQSSKEGMDIVLATNEDNEHNEPRYQTILPHEERFSNWYRLIRTTAWMNRAIKIWLKKPHDSGPLSVEEFKEAEVVWWKKVQWDSFKEEIFSLSKGKDIDKKSRLSCLNPVLDEKNILRINGRLNKLNSGGEFLKSPVILDSKHKFTKLLLFKYHRWAMHQGQESIINEVRQKYWILGIRRAVRSTFSHCLYCQTKRSKLECPQMAGLPKVRLLHNNRAFTATGIDYFGPLGVTVNRHHEKRYGVIFTCMTTRAVHLEIATSLSSDSCIMAIRRFVARRGQPKFILSDNATNFKRANFELKEAFKELDEGKVIDHLTLKGCKWSFIPPAAPHMGGCWERMIRSVKTALYAILKEKFPKEEILYTLICEVENILNSRPLTHVSCDSHDEESLTPNHFLLGTPNNQPVCAPVDPQICLKKSWRVAQQLADQFWKRWLKEYVPTLINRSNNFSSKSPPVKLGDLVLIADENNLRGEWPKGVIVKTLPSQDGNVRIVDVKTAHGTYRRPVTKICRLSLV